jgi:nucleotide-binding universal stress UspA family protein
MPNPDPIPTKAPKLVVGFDDSAESRVALDQAFRFCATWPGTEVIVVRATDGPVTTLPGEPTPEAEARALRQLLDTIHEHFTHLERDGTPVRSARATAHLSTGEPVQTISNIAYTEGVDLILIGMSDKGSLERFVAGSVTRGLLKEAPCSVLICRGRKDRTEPRIEPPPPHNVHLSQLGRRHTYHHESRNAEANSMLPLVFPMP